MSDIVDGATNPGKGPNTLKIRIAAIAVVALAAAPAAAQAAPVLNLNKPCYGALDTVTLSASGFTPGSELALTIGGQQVPGTRTADATGGFGTYSRLAPQSSGKTSKEPWVVTQIGSNPIIAATVVANYARTQVNLKPKRSKPGKKIRVTANGFTIGSRTLRAHMKRRGPYKNLRIGKLKGACGKLNVRKKLFKSKAATGIYIVNFDTARRNSSKTLQQDSFLYSIFKTIVPSSASGSLLGASTARSGNWSAG